MASGIASGYRNAEGNLTGEFGPGTPITYAEITKMALLAAGKQLAEGRPRNRTAQEDWSASFVKTAEELGFSIYQSSLDVHNMATRGETIQTLLEAFGITIETGENPFHDLSSASKYASAIETAFRLGIISGDMDTQGNPVGTVRPNDPVNRAEVAKIIVLLLDSVE